MFSTTTTRLLAGTVLAGAAVVAISAPASAATPSAHRLHALRPAQVHAVTQSTVSIGTAIAYVMGPNGVPVQVSPTTLG